MNSVTPRYDHYGRLGVKCQNAKYLKFCVVVFSGWSELGKVGGGGGGSIIDMCLVWRFSEQLTPEVGIIML